MQRSDQVHRRRRWALTKADWEKFRTSLDILITRKDFANASVEQFNKILTDSILWGARKSVPRGRRPKEVPWWNDEVQESVKKRKMVWVRLLREKTEVAKYYLTEKQKEAHNAIHNAKRDAWKSTVESLSDGADKHLWRILKGMDNRRKLFQPRNLRGSEKLTDHKKADRFLRTFISSSKRLAKETIHRNSYRKEMDRARRRCRRSPLDAFTMKEL